MKPIPEMAMPVVEVLRRDVPKPNTLPVFENTRGWLLFSEKRCPMGLHPKSHSPIPLYNFEFAGGECQKSAVLFFGRWWDRLEAADAREAVDAIWGK